MITPRMSSHARERCKEMGIPTKRAKRIVQQPSAAYRGGDEQGRSVILISVDPDFAVVYSKNHNVIITVLYRDEAMYLQKGSPIKVKETT